MRCKALRDRAMSEVIPDPECRRCDLSPSGSRSVWHDLEEKVVRDLIMAGTRPDGRDNTSLRAIYCETDLLPRVHGSALFQRGETQVAGHRSRWAPRATNNASTDWWTSTARNSCWTTTSRRSRWANVVRFVVRVVVKSVTVAWPNEVSLPCCPPPKISPTRFVSSATFWNPTAAARWLPFVVQRLALMASGVPISNPVAGISIGLVRKSPDDWVLLTDILGNEDHFGDMDFKIAGTQNGITGIQLDLKMTGISEEIIRATLKQSREARIEILRKMLTTISRPRREISPTAPRLLRTKIAPDKIGALIGPGGKNIRGIQESTGAVIEVDDDGTVLVASSNKEAAEEAMRAGRSLHGDRSDRQDLRRHGQQHQGLRRVRRNPARS